ncbi:hypothetical protein V6N11_007887 [Hibiscus sabdariffa]|uniref:Uncharacterized protein n=1 Tax=Hibiscus sabdariffa TaxID=183260 RepID=A0ABR2PZI0_9ROSI
MRPSFRSSLITNVKTNMPPFFTCKNHLSVKENRWRDQTIKISRKFGKENTSLDVSRLSPSDSDIARNQKLKQSAKKALKLGKKIGIQFIGVEDEILEDFVRAKLCEH